MTDMVQRDEPGAPRVQDRHPRRDGLAHAHPQRHAGRGHAVPPLLRVRPVPGRRRRPHQRLADRDVHRQVRGLRARRAADARQAVRRPGRDVLRGHDRGRARQGQRPRRQRRQGQAAHQHARRLGRQGHQLAPPITFTLEEALEYIEDDELVESHAQEHPAAQAAADRERPQEGPPGRRPPRRINPIADCGLGIADFGSNP